MAMRLFPEHRRRRQLALVDDPGNLAVFEREGRAAVELDLFAGFEAAGEVLREGALVLDVYA